MKRTGLTVLFFSVFFTCYQEISATEEVCSRISVDSLFESNTQFCPFTDALQISGLFISGEIKLHSDTSLVRLILMDDKSEEYLIFETYPILAGSRNFSIAEASEETSMLSGIVPFSLSIEIVDASIHLKEIILGREQKYKAELKYAQMLTRSQYKINRINQNIEKNGLSWLAGETSISRLSYQQKKKMFGGRVPNFQGFEYYRGGVFVLPGAKEDIKALNHLKSENSGSPSSSYVKEFSWRNRHGQDWVTPVRNQGICNGCWAFAPTAAAELLLNLYFNRHLDYDLSEQNLISCTGSCSKGGKSAIALNYMKDHGMILEDCLPFDDASPDPACSDSCTVPSDRITISGWNYNCQFPDWKKEIIQGASMASVLSWGPLSNHALQVVGYKILEEDDEFLINSGNAISRVTISHSDNLLGQTALLCKNSWGNDWGDGGYVYIVGSKEDIVLRPIYGPVDSRLYDTKDIHCVDNDGDGYYNWGIGPKPSHCPECPAKPDGNDANPCIGPMDEYGNLFSPTATPKTYDTVILYGQAVPDLIVEGSEIRWYTDKRLNNLVHTGNIYSTGIMDVGDYTYYVTQTLEGCESQASDITLSIWLDIPLPVGRDAFVALEEKAILRVSGKPGALYTWYEDSLLTLKLHSGDIYETGKTDTGSYTYYVTQTLCTLESAPDEVILTIYDPPVNIPDPVFLNTLIKQGVDTNGDGLISLLETRETTSLRLCGEVDATSQICISSPWITSLQGIEKFTSLDSITINCTMLENLDLSAQTKLVYLDCSKNRLKDLNVSRCTLLVNLTCQDNDLSHLVLGTNGSLTRLNCGFNELKGLDLSSNVALEDLSCPSNKLMHLDISNNILLEHLDLSEMPELREVCVWDSNFPTGGFFLDTSDSPSIYFTAECESSSKYVYIPDTAFLEYLIEHGKDVDNDGLISLAEAEGLKSLRLWGRIDCDEEREACYGTGSIQSLEGIQAFQDLRILDCSGHKISSLDLRNLSQLTHLTCEYNQLSNLDVTHNNALVRLSCGNNRISSLDLEKNSNMINLSCENNALTGLDITTCSDLKYLNCSGNQLISLALSKNAALQNLNCHDNNLSSLNISQNLDLAELDCNGNRLSSLDVSANTNLKRIDCDGNGLTSLEVSNISGLKELSCSSNQLERLDISNNVELVGFLCRNNPSLKMICVWTIPFPPQNLYVDISGSDNANFVLDCTTGFKKYEMHGFSAYPNPVTDLLTVKMDHYVAKPARVEIFTLSGQLLYSKQMERAYFQINFSEWERGIYLLVLSSEDFITTGKVVKL
jgi:Leucine-rich repeat (LRR) protein